MRYASHSMNWPRRHTVHAGLRWWRHGLGLGVAMLIGWTILGTVGFALIEGWSLWDGFYMTVITISTVGFAEVYPLSPAGRLFTSFLIIVGIGTAIYTFTRLGQVVLEGELVGGLGRRRMRRELSGLTEHYILCGFGRAARPVAESLFDKSLPFCVIEMDPATESTLQDLGYLYLIDDATSDEALEDAGIQKARAVVTLLPSDADNLYVTVTARALNPGVRVIARAVDERGEVKLRRGGAHEVISPYQLASHRILQAATSPAVLQFMKHVSDRKYMEMSLVEAEVGEGSKLTGLTIADAQLRSDFGVIVVAILREGDPMVFNPGPQERLFAGDVLVLMGPEENLAETVRALRS